MRGSVEPPFQSPSRLPYSQPHQRASHPIAHRAKQSPVRENQYGSTFPGMPQKLLRGCRSRCTRGPVGDVLHPVRGSCWGARSRRPGIEEVDLIAEPDLQPPARPCCLEPRDGLIAERGADLVAAEDRLDPPPPAPERRAGTVLSELTSVELSEPRRTTAARPDDAAALLPAGSEKEYSKGGPRHRRGASGRDGEFLDID